MKTKAPNFENDLKIEIEKISIGSGIKISMKQSLGIVLLDYLTIESKLISIKPRKILFNPEFKKEIEIHTKKIEIETIIEFAKRGKNLNFFQSERAFQCKFNDYLSNEWNVYHFHLSLEKEQKTNFVKQVNSLLFAYIDSDNIVFLGTETHKKGIFGDIRWMKVLQKNYPELISEYHNDYLNKFDNNLTPEQQQSNWEHGISTGSINLNGMTYHSPGFAMVRSGHNINVVAKRNRIMHWIYLINSQIQESYEELCEIMNTPISQAEFKLRIENNKIEIYENSTGLHVLYFPELIKNVS